MDILDKSEKSSGTIILIGSLGSVWKSAGHVFFNHGEFQHAQVIDGKFFIARRNAPVFLEPSNAAFNNITLPVGFTVKLYGTATMTVDFIGFLRNDGLDSVPPQPFSNAGNTVSFVPGQAVGTPAGSTARLVDPHTLHHLFKAGGFMTLSWSQMNRERQAIAIGHQVQFGGKPAPGAPQSLIYGFAAAVFFRAPAAARLARITEPSMQNKFQSIRPCDCIKACRSPTTRSNVPSLLQRLKRSYTVSQGPNHSGTSRHGAPVRIIHSIPLSTIRVSLGGRPRNFGAGKISWRWFHSSSLNSCRRITASPEIWSALPCAAPLPGG